MLPGAPPDRSTDCESPGERGGSDFQYAWPMTSTLLAPTVHPWIELTADGRVVLANGEKVSNPLTTGWLKSPSVIRLDAVGVVDPVGGTMNKSYLPAVKVTCTDGPVPSWYWNRKPV